MWDASPSENSNYPTGCSIPYGTKAHFNTRTTQVECGGGVAEADCLCAPANAGNDADSCKDTPNWTDGTNGCDAYERNDGWCDTYGGNNYPNGNANENCCVCGGGVRDGEPQEVTAIQPVDCEGYWGDWGNCSKDCGGGTQTRKYTISKGAENGGQACTNTNDEEESQACNTEAAS